MTAKYEADKLRQAGADDSLVPLMERIFGIIKESKTSWYDSEDHLKDIADRQDDIHNNEALAQVDKYVEYLSRLNDIKEITASHLNSITAAMQTYYSIWRCSQWQENYSMTHRKSKNNIL